MRANSLRVSSPLIELLSNLVFRHMIQAATMRDWEKARTTIQHEARVIWVAGKQIKDGKPLNDVDDKRLDEALEQITIHGRKLDAR